MTTLTLSASTLLCDGQYWYSSDRIIKIQFVSWPGWHRLIDPIISTEICYDGDDGLLSKNICTVIKKNISTLIKSYHDKWCHCIRNINFISTNCAAELKMMMTSGLVYTRQMSVVHTVHCTLYNAWQVSQLVATGRSGYMWSQSAVSESFMKMLNKPSSSAADQEEVN